MADDTGVFLAVIFQFSINQPDAFIQLAEMPLDDVELVALDAYEFIAMDALKDIFAQCLNPMVHQVQDLLIADLIRICLDQILHDGGCRFSKGIGEHAVQPHLGYRHGVLEAVLLGSPHISKLQAVAAQFPQAPDVCRRDKGCHDKIHPEQAGNMDGIPEIRFLPFGLFYVFRMCQDGLKAALLQDIEKRDPVFACGFHAGVLYALVFEPLRHITDIVGAGRSWRRKMWNWQSR